MKRRIGDLYDKKKFNSAFDRAAKAFVNNVMGEYADTEQGRIAHGKAVLKLNEHIKNVPIEFYQTLEALVDGNDIYEYSEFKGTDKKHEYLKSQGIGILIDIIDSYDKWRVKDPQAAEAYYNGLFRSVSEKRADITDAKIKLRREELKPIIADRLAKFDAEAAVSADERQKLYTMMREEHGRYIESKGVSPSSPAYKIMNRLYKEVDKENQTLKKLESRHFAARRRLIPYQVMSEAGVITKKEDAEYDRLARKELKISGELDCYVGMLDELNEVRYKNGVISETQYYMKHDGQRTPERNKPYIIMTEQVDISKSVKGMSKTVPMAENGKTTPEIEREKGL